ncbi:MAG: hypothetical protein AAFQ74_12480 [Cyanobacteria bacterium J06623_4]
MEAGGGFFDCGARGAVFGGVVYAYESVGFKPYETLYADYFINNFGIEFEGFTKFGQLLTSTQSQS